MYFVVEEQPDIFWARNGDQRTLTKASYFTACTSKSKRASFLQHLVGEVTSNSEAAEREAFRRGLRARWAGLLERAEFHIQPYSTGLHTSQRTSKSKRASFLQHLVGEVTSNSEAAEREVFRLHPSHPVYVARACIPAA